MRKRIGKDRVYIYFIDNDDGFIREIISKTDQLNSYNIQIYLRSRDFINDFARFKPILPAPIIIILITLWTF